MNKFIIFFVSMVLLVSFGLAQDDIYDMSLEDIMNMEVTTASKSEEQVSDAPGVISVISKDEIRRFGGTTLKDILERVPSLVSSTVYMTDRSTIAPRGDQILPSSSHVLLLINGRPVRESLEGGIKSEMYESFPVDIIERIEVIRGPGSVLYGSNAFSAVINVKTESVEENDITVSGLADPAGGYGGRAKAQAKLGDLSISAAGQYMNNKEWKTDWQYGIPGPQPHDTTIQTNNPNVGAGSYLEMRYKGLSFMGSYNQWEHSYYVPDYAFLFPAYGEAKWTKTFADLGYSFAVSDNWNMDLNATYTKSTFETDSWPSTDRNSYETVLEWTNFVNPTDEIGVVFGGTYNYFQGKEEVPDIGTLTDANRNSLAFYTQVDYQMLESLKLIGGLQANKVEDIDLNVVPRLGLIYYFMEDLNTKILYSEAFRAPSINETSIDYYALRGDPDLVPENVRTLDIGFNYPGDKVQLGTNFFWSEQTNIIFQDRSGEIPVYNNGDEVTFYGLEFEGKYYVNKKIYLTGSALYQTNEDQNGNEDVTPISNIGMKGGVSYKSGRGITASLFNIYQGDLHERYETQLNPSPEAYNKMNIHINWNLNKFFDLNMNQKFSVFVEIDNALDQEIWKPAWGMTTGKSIPVNQGRTVYLGTEISL